MVRTSTGNSRRVERLSAVMVLSEATKARHAIALGRRTYVAGFGPAADLRGAAARSPRRGSSPRRPIPRIVVIAAAKPAAISKANGIRRYFGRDRSIYRN